MFNHYVREGIKRIWTEDEETQNIAVLEIGRDIRHYDYLTDEQIIKLFRDDMNSFYVPNDGYISHFFDVELTDFKYGIYKGEECNYYQRLVFPIYGLNDKVTALCAYANDVDPKYIYSPKTIWEKGRHMYLTKEQFLKAIKDDYLIIVDGIFDAVSLRQQGYNAVSLMGGEFTEWHRYYFSFIKKLIVFPDNDNAGNTLAFKVSKAHNNVTIVKQGESKDIDDFLKKRNGGRRLEKLFNCENLSELNLNLIKIKRSREFYS